MGILKDLFYLQQETHLVVCGAMELCKLLIFFHSSSIVLSRNHYRSAVRGRRSNRGSNFVDSKDPDGGNETAKYKNGWTADCFADLCSTNGRFMRKWCEIENNNRHKSKTVTLHFFFVDSLTFFI